MSRKNRYIVFGDVVEDPETGIYYCLIKASQAVRKVKTYVFCLELNNKLEFLQRPPSIFDRATIKDFYHVENISDKIKDYLEAMKINFTVTDVRDLGFLCKYRN